MRAPAFGERWEARRLLAFLAALSVATALFTLYAGTAKADSHFFLNVDGVQYSPTQESGPVRHYETPDTDPTSAYSDRHTWTGNGSEHLPCPGGIHWIDNNNLLTVSHCLEDETTTTTIVEDTTTTSVEDTTTTSVEDTTTTSVEDTTTTSVEDTTTTTVEQTTTTSVEDTTTTSVEDTTTTSVEDTTTTSVEDTTTTSVEDTTTTSVEDTTTTSVEDTTTTSEQETTTTTEDDPEVLPTVVTTTPDEVDDEELPFTGLEAEVMFGIAVLLFGLGAALLVMTRRVEDES